MDTDYGEPLDPWCVPDWAGSVWSGIYSKFDVQLIATSGAASFTPRQWGMLRALCCDVCVCVVCVCVCVVCVLC